MITINHARQEMRRISKWTWMMILLSHFSTEEQQQQRTLSRVAKRPHDNLTPRAEAPFTIS
jgi:hypothetical protein